MDMANPFETPNTYRLHRAEYLVGLVAVAGLFIAHIGEVRWVPAVILFAYIDLIGYIPGAIAYRRSPDHRVAKGYYIAYNVMHSMITQMVVAAVWIAVAGFEWALLVLPLHLFADRGVFGNFLKPFSLAFEPEPNPAYTRMAAELRHRERRRQRESAMAGASGASR
ncbi:hypothetical protein ACFY8O_25075 [Streptomyces argenteolus]|uniref:Integral membrane protein n=1 Tax=Streptomyces argenteolus TaxID=67274 RepID=A0ABW6XBR1_9ACTN